MGALLKGASIWHTKLRRLRRWTGFGNRGHERRDPVLDRPHRLYQPVAAQEGRRADLSTSVLDATTVVKPLRSNSNRTAIYSLPVFSKPW